MCMCGEWMVYGDDFDNNGESLIPLVLFLRDTYLSCSLKLRRMRCSIFSFSFLLGGYCTPNSTVGQLSIFTSRLTFSFLSRFRTLAPFYFLVSFIFFRAFISWNKIASGSDQDNLSTEIGECFWLFSPGLGVHYFWVVLEMEMGGYMWMCTSGVEAACVSEHASESWFNHKTSS